MQYRQAQPADATVIRQMIETYDDHIAKLASFIQNHPRTNGYDQALTDLRFVELKCTDAEIAWRLDIPIRAIEECYVTLAELQVIRRFPGRRLEILNKRRLAELAESAGRHSSRRRPGLELERSAMDAKSLLIGALVIALLAGGYFYHVHQPDQVRADGSGVKIESH